MSAQGAQPWVLATRSAGKLRELRALCADEGIAVVDLREAGVAEAAAEDDVECHPTFEENALAKSRYFSALLPDRVVVADDSGLQVHALGNAPGVLSKRWSGRPDLAGSDLDAANNTLLLQRLAGEEDRRARFVCAATWASAGVEVVATGEVAGRIAATSSGSLGFGYDPFFHVLELGMSLGAASVAEKQRVSHRARAFISLLARLRADGRVG